ncbi:MAG TPA: baseplate J/gp47 family protein [Symbiobacteriaceae bacterium]|nr:baseplate J/gp47 family protein [Symbiobacteriaceae bacterium]
MTLPPPYGVPSYQEVVQSTLDRLRAGGQLTDVNPGSVLRTLVEAFARELAEAYGRMGALYELGFLDTATGQSLDHLIALVGKKRLAGLRVQGEAAFVRDPHVAQRIRIPAGTTLYAQKGEAKIPYQTESDAELAAGQTVIIVPVTAEIPPTKKLEELLLGPNETGQEHPLEQVAPLAGIGQVYMARPTTPRQAQESDEALRTRVKTELASRGSGTLRAMEQAVLQAGARSVTFRDALTAKDRVPPGELEVVVDADLGEGLTYQAVWDALLATKPPGVLVHLRGLRYRPLFLELHLRPAVARPSTEVRRTIRQQVEAAVLDALGALSPGESLRWNPLMAKLLATAGVLDILRAQVQLDGEWLSQPADQPLPSRLIPPTLEELDRIVAPATGPVVSVIFDGEELLWVQLLVRTETTNQDWKRAVARGLAKGLAALNDQTGERSLTLSLLRQWAGQELEPAGRTWLAQAGLAVRLIDRQGGAELLLPADGSFPLDATDLVYPHPDGPVWGVG